MRLLNETHNPALQSWVACANQAVGTVLPARGASRIC